MGKGFMKHFFIITNRMRDRDLSVTERIRLYINEHGGEAVMAESTGDKNIRYTDFSKAPDNIDAVISVGGDGTLIAAARDMADLDLPILGVNQGNLGYLTDTDAKTLEDSLCRLIKGDFDIEYRMMLCGQVYDKEGELKGESRALNDVVLHTSESLKVVNYLVSVNGSFLGKFPSDGIVVSTPTGSTAYSLSAGGPILEPTAQMMVITPICPHMLNTRSMVLDSANHLELRAEDNGIKVYFDGGLPLELETGDRVEIRKSSHVTRIIRTHPGNFYKVLRDKFE